MRVRCCEATFFEAHADEQRIITEAHLAADAARIGALIGRAVGELRALLEAKADPNQARSDGRTALIFPAVNGHEPCLHTLFASMRGTWQPVGLSERC